MTNTPLPPVAIVGAAFDLPGASDFDSFATLLAQRSDAVAEVPAHRREDAGLTAATDLSECALLDRIDLFDAEYFGLSAREARQMDPQQRLLLQLSARAVWDAGVSLDHLRDTDTAVTFGASAVEYRSLLGHIPDALVTGLLPAAQAGRVAHLLRLGGPVSTVDTACSSTLSAVLDASRRVAYGEVDWALTGGVRLLPIPPGLSEPGAESIVSPSGRSRSFDAAADGTGLGEGGAVFLLKLLSRAREDADPIHAIILGGASNHDGGRTNGFAAPSVAAQEAVLLKAWEAAGIHPNSLGAIEAHGTGTRLGDPIEFQALTSAFARRTDRTGFCTLSSIKSNVGHLDSAAGAAGLVKAITSLRTGVRYASAHYCTPNPLLDLENSALSLTAHSQRWDESAQRRIGISSFGLTGTNVHLVLEQPPTEWSPTRAVAHRPVLIPIAARTESAVSRTARALADQLGTDGADIADVAAVQALGRDHRRVRATVVADTTGEAVRALTAIADGSSITDTRAAVPVILLAHESPSIDTESWVQAFPSLGDWRARQRDRVAGENPAADGVIDRLLPIRALVDAGVSDRVVIGSGRGNVLLDVLRGEVDPATAASVGDKVDSVSPPTLDRLREVLDTVATMGTPVMVAPWSGALVDVMTTAAHERGEHVFTFDSADPRAVILSAVGALFRAGVDVDWHRLVEFVGGYGRRISLPAPFFEPQRHWVDIAQACIGQHEGPALAPAAAGGRLEGENGSDTELALATIWCSVLECPSVSRDDDFFSIGGDSLMQVQIENALRRDFGVEVSFDVFYEYPTLRELAHHIDSLDRETDVVDGPRRDISRKEAPATHSQRRMWLLQELDRDSGVYNVAVSCAVDGVVDDAALKRALDALATRHSILRTRLVLQDSVLTQFVDPPGAFSLSVEDLGSEVDALSALRLHAQKPFDLAAGNAARAVLLRESAVGGRAWFQFVVHHALCDEKSIGILLDELSADYSAQRTDSLPTAEPDLQFLDWAAWEAVQERSVDSEYWIEQLSGAPVELPLPTDFPYGPQQDYAGQWLEFTISRNVVDAVRRATRDRDGTLFTWLMTAYAAWLARLTQAEDFLIGVPVAGRYRSESETIPGCFVNTLVLRVDASGDPSFDTLYQRVRSALVGAFDHQRHPFDVLVEQIGAGGNASRPPLVQTLLSLQGAGQGGKRQLGHSTLSPLQVDTATSWFDLSSVLWEEPDGSLGGIVAYRTALYERESVAGFLADWLALVEAGLTDPHVSIHTILGDNSW